MSTAIDTLIAQLRDEIETRTAALQALERLINDTPPLIEVRAIPERRPQPGAPRAQIDLEEAIAAKDAPPSDAAPTTRTRGKVDVTRLRALHAQGLTDGQIAARLGCSGSAILWQRRKLDLAANGKGGPTAATAGGGTRVNSAATIVAWPRGRDTVIVEVEPGKAWQVNGRDVIDRDGLLTMANRKRGLAKLPPFAWEFGP